MLDSSLRFNEMYHGPMGHALWAHNACNDARRSLGRAGPIFGEPGLLEKKGANITRQETTNRYNENDDDGVNTLALMSQARSRGRGQM